MSKHQAFENCMGELYAGGGGRRKGTFYPWKIQRGAVDEQGGKGEVIDVKAERVSDVDDDAPSPQGEEGGVFKSVVERVGRVIGEGDDARRRRFDVLGGLPVRVNVPGGVVRVF